jgi:hypothetical protein
VTSNPPLLMSSTAAGGNCRSCLRKGSGSAAGVLTLLSVGFVLYPGCLQMQIGSTAGDGLNDSK